MRGQGFEGKGPCDCNLNNRMVMVGALVIVCPSDCFKKQLSALFAEY